MIRIPRLPWTWQSNITKAVTFAQENGGFKCLKKYKNLSINYFRGRSDYRKVSVKDACFKERLEGTEAEKQY